MQIEAVDSVPKLMLAAPARQRYSFPTEKLAEDGQLILKSQQQALLTAEKINEIRKTTDSQHSWIEASELLAAALMSMVSRKVIHRASSHGNSPLELRFQEILTRELAPDSLRKLRKAWFEHYPPREAGTLDSSLSATGANTISLGNLAVLWLARRNPAMDGLRELLDDSELESLRGYAEAVECLEQLLSGESPNMGKGGRAGPTLRDILLGPIRHAPHSLREQLAFIRENWGGWIGESDSIILAAMDFLNEQKRPHFPPGPGPIEVPDYSREDSSAPIAFSEDLDWMPRVVLLAKNAYVWLSQLSKQYGYHIETLNDIPDAELDRLASRGFTALWLIGVWERSRASEKIKRWMGDEEAVASAYSLYDYVVATRLGGAPNYEKLRDRAAARGIRMMTDMVPNHVGIDGRWVIEHPDWFISENSCPFPSYRFDGADLCEDERVGVYIEDGYWDRSDAAVVFKRVDHWTGECRYIYHGNDGTSMPWNDTAQLNYLNKELREAVIQTILHVARQSPILRFDAAMTLTRENFRRLWFPEPGHGGDIPSRSARAMSREEFDSMMPREFWRELVDRIAKEAPNTLLLAEAFWMLEGYFVRSLGMHRVYNSAFMNMLRDERNAEYRKLIRETLEFDPRILSRYVNFMSNPDEDTAIDGFGTGDKYFGICTLMASMPGLPMFGHGQIEGFSEKYGMEFHRPRWQEKINQEILGTHHRLIFPLLRRRASFAGVDSFRLYDFKRENGDVDENVFAYSNDLGGDRSLIVFNNSFSDTSGRIRRAVPTRIGMDSGPGDLIYPDLDQGLSLDSSSVFLHMRDHVTGKEYLYEISELREHGLKLQLGAYQYQVFLDLREISEDPGGHWRKLAGKLSGRGCPDLEQALAELRFSKILSEWKLFSDEIRRSSTSIEAEGKALHLLAEIRKEFPSDQPLAQEAMDLFEHIRPLTREEAGTEGLREDSAWILQVSNALLFLKRAILKEDDGAGPLLRRLRQSLDEPTASKSETKSSTLLILLSIFKEIEADEIQNPPLLLERLLANDEIKGLLEIHKWEGLSYFRQEGMDSLVQALEETANLLSPPETAEKSRERTLEFAENLKRATEASEWKLEKLRRSVKEITSDSPTKV